MNDAPSTPPARARYPAGFRPRRGLNWGLLGLTYTSFYLCRYNLPLANKAMSDEFGFSRADVGKVFSAWALAYGCGQFINGLLTDRLGCKRAMLIGAIGTIVMNLMFGVASFGGMLGLFMVIRGLDGYLQAFGSPGWIKINAAWFSHDERGRFAGIYGFMINLGRFGINYFGPALLAGFTFLGMMQVPPLHWRWLFWAPSIICAVVALAMAIFVRETPEEAGFPGVVRHDQPAALRGEPVRLGVIFRTIAGNRTIWIIAAAYACTGTVRQAVDQWFPRYMQELYHVDLRSVSFQFLAFLIPFVASAGSLISGYVSDTLFRGRRTPVAALLYFIETGVILLAAQFHSVNAAIFFLVLISFTANSTHSILGVAAAMDIGGHKMAGFAAGLIDSFQYFGASLAGYFLGLALDRSLGNYFYFMAPFGVIGGTLMLTILGRVSGRPPAAVPATAT